MLRALQIENYALIRSLRMAFDRGLTVITGETGAGKSILMGALSLILGSRAETEVLRDKTRKCIVEGLFDIEGLDLRNFFEQNDLDYQPLTTLRREINESGKSRAFINDTPVTLVILRTLAGKLIDIHSQLQNLLPRDSSFRLRVIDQYAQNGDLRIRYRQNLSQLRQLEQQHADLKQKCTEDALRQEFLQYTVEELDKAQLQPGEQELTEQQIRLLSHAEEIKSHLYAAAQQLSEQEEGNVLQQLKAVQAECESLRDLGPDFEEIRHRLHEAAVELKDIAYEIARKEDEVEVNPQELDRLNERIDLIYTLQHKYQVDNIPELLALADRLRQELSQQSNDKEQLQELEKACHAARKETLALAQQLSKSRQQVIAKLQKEIEHHLRELGMPDSRMEIVLEPVDEMQESGMDRATFLFTANPGMEPADLGKVASGGEMSRIMLALKSVITDSTVLPTVIFDEIDTGISGETAHKVGVAMQALSQRHQVVAITHLPQIAARGNRHLLVFKENREGEAVTDLRPLEGEERVEAIATMFGGAGTTEAARATARELLKKQ
ncbi:MAG: DNA repair protein RecN [Bacteroidales bacterium]|nr:DNA repair protein RecN [Bacteroidales bacterium]